MVDRERISQLTYWAALAALIVVKTALVSDLAVIIQFSPHDDSLYVMRAFHFLNGAGFGPYDSHVLAKLPAMSLWLAGLRQLGLPYLPTLNVLYVAAGLYALAAFRRSGMARIVLVAVFALYLFNPVTMGSEWIRILREPLSTVLLVACMAATLHILVSLRRKQPYAPHLVFLAVLLAFSTLLREEDRLLWGLLVLFLGTAWLGAGERRVARLAVIALVPAIAIVAANFAARQAVERWYALPILHDYSEGEYPRLLAAIRGIVTAKDNRLVMVTQEALAKLRVEAPEFALVVDRLPPPSPASFSCRLQGVCSEWSNGWMPFLIKDVAAEAGLTPTLPAAQAYFQRVRERIEAACAAGRLKCEDRGSGIVPPFELRWTRGYVQELAQLLGMLLLPRANTVGEPRSRFTVSPELGRIFQAVTMTDNFDAERETRLGEDRDRLYRNPLAPLRTVIALPLQLLAALLLVASLPALAYRWLRCWVLPPDAFLWLATMWYAYVAVRLAALAYIATFFGPFDWRVLFSTYTVGLILAPLLLVDALRARRAAPPGIQ